MRRSPAESLAPRPDFKVFAENGGLLRFGAVSFLNARPLIEGLDKRPDVQVLSDVPARLGDLLAVGAVDVALLPVIDILRSREPLQVVSDACIGCDGPTMTVRVYSHRPPHEIRRLAGDTHSHTSWALARVLWRELYGADLEISPYAAEGDAPREPGDTDAVLLIGDKVVHPSRPDYAYEVDLGGAWRSLTGLPFAFAVWAARLDHLAKVEQAGPILEQARDRGVARAIEIARTEGPTHGWPTALAERYLTSSLRFTLDSRTRAGVERFAALARDCGAAPAGAVAVWRRACAGLVPVESAA